MVDLYRKGLDMFYLQLGAGTGFWGSVATSCWVSVVDSPVMFSGKWQEEGRLIIINLLYIHSCRYNVMDLWSMYHNMVLRMWNQITRRDWWLMFEKWKQQTKAFTKGQDVNSNVYLLGRAQGVWTAIETDLLLCKQCTIILNVSYTNLHTANMNIHCTPCQSG